MMPMIATTINNSMSEKPDWPFNCCMMCLALHNRIAKWRSGLSLNV
jgi:hypothetical protein